MELTEQKIEEIGSRLEHNGLTDDEIDAHFLEHFGVKGMKWGVRRQKAVAAAKQRAKTPDRKGNRNNVKAQRRVDVVRRIASGKATKQDYGIALVNSLLQQGPLGTAIEVGAGGGVKGAAANRLDRAAKLQGKIGSGKKRVTDKLLRMQGVDIRELKYGYSGQAKKTATSVKKKTAPAA